MKRSTIFLTALGLLAFWAVFQVWSEARENAEKATNPAPVYDSTGAMLEAIYPEIEGAAVARVYDSTGAMLEAINPQEPKVVPLLVYDARGVMEQAINPSSATAGTNPPIMYDATGVMLTAISP